jgi:hypothetical protein
VGRGVGEVRSGEGEVWRGEERERERERDEWVSEERDAQASK